MITSFAASGENRGGMAGDGKGIKITRSGKHETVEVVSMQDRLSQQRLKVLYLFPHDQADVRITALMTPGSPSKKSRSQKNDPTPGGLDECRIRTNPSIHNSSNPRRSGSSLGTNIESCVQANIVPGNLLLVS